MPIEFSCACGKKFAVRESLAGKTATCRNCGRSMTIPEPDVLEAQVRLVEGELAPRFADRVV